MADKTNITLFRAWVIILVLLVLTTLSTIDRISISLMVDLIKGSFRITDLQMSWIQGPAFAIFFLFGSLPMGWLVDRYSNRWIIYFGVTLWSLATIFCGLSGNYTELLIARCIVGLGEAALQPAAWSITASIFPKHKLSFAISVLTAGGQIGAAISMLLGGFLISEANVISSSSTELFFSKFEPWQLVFFMSGLPGILLAFSIFLAPSNKHRVNKQYRVSPKEFLQFITFNRQFFICHFLGYGLLSAMVYGAAAWLPTVLMRSQGLEPDKVGVIMAIMAVPIGMCGAVIAGWLVDRSFARGGKNAHLTHFAFRASAIAIIGSLGFLVMDSSIIYLLAAFGIIQFLQPFSGVAGASLQIVTPPEYRGRISAAFVMFYNAIGMLLGPSFVIFVKDFLLHTDNLANAIGLNYLIFGSTAAILLWKGSRYLVSINNNLLTK
mgnify:CR=1 FL=1